VPAFNCDVIIRVLAHRADHAASKFLKSELSLPKAGAKHGVPFHMPTFPKKMMAGSAMPKLEGSRGSFTAGLTRFKQKLKGTSLRMGSPA
jgi:hypothetical protein